MAELRELVRTKLPTQFGTFNMVAYDSGFPDFPHMLLYTEGIADLKAPYVRIHSECMTGDVFGSVRCECGEQLDLSLEKIGQDGGALVYLRQEGRGIGIIEKMKAYNLQDQGMNTVEANLALGHQNDTREFGLAVKALEALSLDTIRLITNNPIKISTFDTSSISVVERIPLDIKAKRENKGYLRTKKDILGHLINL